MKIKFLIALSVMMFMVLLLVDPAIAGPGGKIAKAAFETFWGRIVLAILIIFFLPLITWVLIQEKMSERRSRKDLGFMAGYSPAFDWLKIQQRAKECFYRVHAGWEKEDLSEAAQWMTDWYWQNQQLAHLNKWQQQGLVNICDVKKIRGMKPLLFVHRNSGAEHEDSTLAVSITAVMKDYLQERKTGKVVEGSKRYKDVETIWVFSLESGVWKVAEIEEDSMSLSYARMAKTLPRIETTLASNTFKA